MNTLDIILLPFTLIYRGFITVLLLPYYLIVGIGKVFSGNKGSKPKDKKVIPEIKPGEQVKVVKDVKSAYEKPVKEPKETDPNVLKQKKFENNIKKQKEFEKLVAKARKEEERRVKEQEKIRAEAERKAKEKIDKELARRKKEEEMEALRLKREEELKAKGEPVTFSEKLKHFWAKI